MPSHRQNRADYRLTLEGRDLRHDAPNVFAEILRERFAETISPRLISLTLTEKRGGEADQLDIVLHDHDGALELPKPGAVLALQLGWVEGSDVPIGLVDKGRFKVDEVEWSGPPDIVTLRARSANFSASFDQRQHRSHIGRTLGEIVSDIATRQNLTAQIAAELADIVIDAIEQNGMSDAALLRRLGRRYDAAATIKAGRLIFAPIGAGQTASGTPIPVASITRASGDRYSYRRGERGQFGGVEAEWDDRNAAERKTVATGAASDRPRKKLKRSFASEAAAKRAAQSESEKMERAAAEFEIELVHGRPDLYPDRALAVSGFKSEIDGQAWLVGELTHALDAGGGLATRMKLEAKA
ncbi:contractile injection system protein, VgrG/Pvc8 family [uncultured Croceicoccus sp.]|uniref:contractile injection system protein, VgrG/Pvc8 family n=1 Tax=uncultured Croceicoccus sp. TaxID=1295329 RepID=UPI002636C605|nr:contractile injection system protein, VgrG/Pvc8 family [uncultured Croceicoccus sp.]